jgi:hypothetical protein
MRKPSIRIFVVFALALAVGLAVGVSPWADGSPDGLEKVAGDKGFLADGKVHSIQDSSPIPDYAFPGIDNPRLATAVAGFVGTLGVCLLAFGIAWLVKRRGAAAGVRGAAGAV